MNSTRTALAVQIRSPRPSIDAAAPGLAVNGGVAGRQTGGDHLQLYRQFRSQYPEGRLTTELLSLEGGQFVIRAQIELNGALIATGLAAAQTIEQAEDRARARALELLGLAIAESPPPAALEVDVHVMTEAPAARPAPSLKPEDEAPLLEAEVEQLPEEAKLSVGVTRRPAQPSGVEAHSEAVLPLMEPHLAAVPDPVPSDDWSEELADIEAELKRLGWTLAQEQGHLLQSYGCRSRSLITDYSQLTDYLSFLRQQPSPLQSVAKSSAPLSPLLKAPAQLPLEPSVPTVSPVDSPAESASVGRSPVVELPRFSSAPGLGMPGLNRDEMMELSSSAVKRLGWTNRQGSEYLRMTYGKTNRQQLTNEELQQFLDYLTQMSPPVDQVPF
jgi:hypothetical protein